MDAHWRKPSTRNIAAKISFLAKHLRVACCSKLASQVNVVDAGNFQPHVLNYATGYIGNGGV